MPHKGVINYTPSAHSHIPGIATRNFKKKNCEVRSLAYLQLCKQGPFQGVWETKFTSRLQGWSPTRGSGGSFVCHNGKAERYKTVSECTKIAHNFTKIFWEGVKTPELPAVPASKEMGGDEKDL